MMVNSVKSFLIVALFMSFLIVGCKEDVPVGPTLPYNDLSAFFDTQKPVEQSFSIDPTTTQTVTGTKGTKITFNANSFVDAQGNAVTGQVDFKMKEIYSKGDMIWAERMTIASNGKLLESGGEFSLKATSGGQEVFLNQNYRMEVPISSATSNPNAMDLFVAQESDSTWTPVDSSGWVGVDSIANTYNVYFDSLSWINCDYFYGSTQGLTQVNVEPRVAGVTLTDVSVFLVFNNINAVTSMWSNSTSGVFSISGMPIGESVTIVAIGMDGTQFYMGTLSTTLNNSSTIAMPLTPTTEAQIITTISNL